MFRTKKVCFFLLPGIALILIFYMFPFMDGIRYSLLDGSFSNAFVGLDNYRQVWSNPLFQLGLRNTFELSLICVPAVWVLSFLIAAGIADLYPKGEFARTVIMMPYLMPASALILIWQFLFDNGGLLNRALTSAGLQRIFWFSERMRFPVIVMFLWKNLGLCAVIFLAAIRSVPRSLYESANLDGISRMRRNLNITLPMILPSAYMVFIISWINAFKIFREVYFLSGSYPQDETVYTLQHYMNNVYSTLNYQRVTAAAYSFAVIVVVLFGILFFLQQRTADEING